MEGVGEGMDAMSAQTVQHRVEELASEVEGIIGVYVKDLGSGTEVALNANTVFPMASVVKVPILFELYRQAEAGEIDLGRRIAFEERHLVPGSGVLQDLAFGISPTVKDLATLMITVSDNAATDMLLDLVTLNRVESTMRNLGLTATTVPMTIRGILYSMVGMDPANPAHTYDLFKERAQANRIDWESRALADADNNLSTPCDLGRLLEGIERRQTLSAASCDAIIDILKRQKYNSVLPLHLPEGTAVAHKTGSLRGVRNDAGIVYGPQGPYVIAVCAKQLADSVAGAAALAAISREIYTFFNGPIPEPRYGPQTA